MKKAITLFIVIVSFICLFSHLSSGASINLKLYIEGYYIGNGIMEPLLLGCGVTGSTINQTDTILVELHDAITPSTTIDFTKAILLRDGTALCTFSNSLIGNSYYVAIKHKGTIETWSMAPVAINAITNYDFSTASTQAFGGNMVLVDATLGLWAFYSGDFNQDENIDLLDFPVLNFLINNGSFGCPSEDLNGDGNIDLLDYPVFNRNLNAGIFSLHP